MSYEKGRNISETGDNAFIDKNTRTKVFEMDRR